MAEILLALGQATPRFTPITKMNNVEETGKKMGELTVYD